MAKENTTQDWLAKEKELVGLIAIDNEGYEGKEKFVIASLAPYFAAPIRLAFAADNYAVQEPCLRDDYMGTGEMWESYKRMRDSLEREVQRAHEDVVKAVTAVNAIAANYGFVDPPYFDIDPERMEETDLLAFCQEYQKSIGGNILELCQAEKEEQQSRLTDPRYAGERGKSGKEFFAMIKKALQFEPMTEDRVLREYAEANEYLYGTKELPKDGESTDLNSGEEAEGWAYEYEDPQIDENASL